MQIVLSRALAVLAGAVGYALADASNNSSSDYLIVGGGVAGLVLAARLSEDASKTVTVLEAGPNPSGNTDISTPAFAGLLQGSQFSWNFTNIPQKTLGGIAPSLAQGHALGGGSAINVMAYCRGAPSVFDEWATASGIPGLAWSKLEPYFQKSTVLQVPNGPDYQVVVNGGPGEFGNGSVHVSYEQQLLKTEPFFWKAFQNSSTGEVLVDLTSGKTGIGIALGGPHAIISGNGTRSYAWPAYGFAAAARPNVRVIHGAWASKILFDGTRAVGATWSSAADNSTHTELAKEVILTAGALNTPKLLMLSGIGPKDHLSSLSIPVVKDVPELGSNLYDHHSAVVMVEVPSFIFTSVQASNASILDPLLAQYHANGTGPLSNPGASSFIAERVPDSVLKSFGVNVTFQLNLPADRPHLLYQYANAPFQPNPENKNVVSAFVAVIQPEAAGSVRLASSNFRDDPLLDSNYYGSPGDLALQLYAYKRLLNIMRSEKLAPIVLSEVYPGSNVTTKDGILKAVQQSARSFHHPAGTASLGKVLDTEFRIPGIDGLRVIDSSAVPNLPTCHLQASIYALAEFAADMLKSEFGQ
jgi:choline dehydrogenase